MSRVPPPRVPPIVVGQVRYGRDSGYQGPFLELFDAGTGTKTRAVEIYRYPLIPDMETDVQEVFFKSMALVEGGKDLLIENERGHRFLFNLATGEVRERTHPCTLRLVAWEQVGPRWKVQVELSTANVLPKSDFLLDRVSFGDTPRLRNNLFEVRSGARELPYRGAMAKRQASPEDLIRLGPGERHATTIELGEYYDFPEQGGVFRIRYRHHNHFSPNAVDLESNVITVELHPGQSFRAQPKAQTTR